MKRSISIIAAAAMAASLTLAGAVSVYAEEETTTQAAAETAPTLSIEDITGKWKYEATNLLFVGDVDDINNAYAVGKVGGIVEIKSDSTYTFSKDGGSSESGIVKIGTEEIGGTSAQTVNFYVGDEFSFGGYYHDDTDTISIGNGGTEQLVRYNGETETTTTTNAAATTTTTTTTAATTTTTSGTTTTTTKNGTTTTTTKAKSSSSPKTGVAFPALAVAGLGISTAAVAFALRKKED